MDQNILKAFMDNIFPYPLDQLKTLPETGSLFVGNNTMETSMSYPGVEIIVSVTTITTRILLRVCL